MQILNAAEVVMFVGLMVGGFSWYPWYLVPITVVGGAALAPILFSATTEELRPTWCILGVILAIALVVLGLSLGAPKTR